MKKLLLVLLVATLSSLMAFAQTPPAQPAIPTIERVDITGVDDSRLSATLRADIQKLVGQPYNAQTVEALTLDIQVELPEYVAAATTQPGTQPERVRLVLLVAKISDNDALANNINSRYIVDAVEFEGTKVRISDGLNDELQTMVGANVNSSQLSAFAQRIRQENRGQNLSVDWKLRRSAEPQHVKVVYEVRKITNTLHFNVLNGVYHSRQGFSGTLFGLTYTNVPAGTFTFSMLNSAEELIERFSGYRAGYSFDLINNPRLRFDVNYSSLRTQWKTNTLQADMQSPLSPGLYRLRDTLSGELLLSHPFAAGSRLTASAHVEFTELEMQTPKPGFQKSNVARGRLQYAYVRRTAEETLEFSSSYEGATGTGVIDSDFIFARHEAKLDFHYSLKSHGVLLYFQAGRTTGTAPM